MSETLEPQEEHVLESQFSADKNAADYIEDNEKAALADIDESESAAIQAYRAEQHSSHIEDAKASREENTERAKQYVDERLDKVKNQAAEDMATKTGERPNLDQDQDK